MMTFGELLGAILGWLGELIEFIISFVPRIVIVQFNERGVRYIRGKEPTEIKPGIHWYWPWCTEVEVHHVCRMVIPVESLPLETADDPPRRVEVGMILTCHIVDVLKFEVENVDADESMAEAAQGALQDIVTSSTWVDLHGETAEGTRLGGKLARRMGKTLERFGVEVETCRPTAQISLDNATRHFGIHQHLSFGVRD